MLTAILRRYRHIDYTIPYFHYVLFDFRIPPKDFWTKDPEVPNRLLVVYTGIATKMSGCSILIKF